MKMLVVWGAKGQRKKAKRGQKLDENKYVQNSTKSKEKYKSTTEIMTVDLDVENTGGWGPNQQRKRANWGQKLHKKKCV